MVLFTYNNLVSLIANSNIIAGCKSAWELKNIDLSKKENLLVAKEVNVGFAATTLISKI